MLSHSCVHQISHCTAYFPVVPYGHTLCECISVAHYLSWTLNISQDWSCRQNNGSWDEYNRHGNSLCSVCWDLGVALDVKFPANNGGWHLQWNWKKDHMTLVCLMCKSFVTFICRVRWWILILFAKAKTWHSIKATSKWLYNKMKNPKI